jgi:nicotinamidase-related amidase
MVGLARADSCGLLVVDVQTRFLAPIAEGGRVIQRARFMCQAAQALGIPILASEQVPDKMGGTCAELASLGLPTFPKTRFSAADEEATRNWIDAAGLTQIAIVGIETPICVLQTAIELAQEGYDVFVVADAVSGRTLESHHLALRRIEAAGVRLAFSESLVYEWMENANHPAFRTVLDLVKQVNPTP